MLMHHLTLSSSTDDVCVCVEISYFCLPQIVRDGRMWHSKKFVSQSAADETIAYN